MEFLSRHFDSGVESHKNDAALGVSERIQCYSSSRARLKGVVGGLVDRLGKLGVI